MSKKAEPSIVGRVFGASVWNGRRYECATVPARAYWMPSILVVLMTAWFAGSAVAAAMHRGDTTQALANAMLAATGAVIGIAVAIIANWVMLRRVGVEIGSGMMRPLRGWVHTAVNMAIIFPGSILPVVLVARNVPDGHYWGRWLSAVGDIPSLFPVWGASSQLPGTPDLFLMLVVYPAILFGSWIYLARKATWRGPFDVAMVVAAPEAENAVRLKLVRLHGQERAVAAAKEAIGEWMDSNEGMPLSLLFSGPSGVGKTQLAENLSRMYGRNLCQFNMGELGGGTSTGGSSIAKDALLGLPAGYRESEKGGLLTNELGRNPNGIFLFDEMEKAPNDAYDIFLNMLDKGWIKDARGKRYDCRNAIVIFTTNVGRDIDPNLPEAKVRDKMTRAGFRPELMGRIHKLIQFMPMTLEIAGKIATGALRKELARQMDRKLASDKRKEIKDLPAIVWQPDMVAKRSALEPLGFESYGVRVMQRFAKEKAAEIVEAMNSHEGAVNRVVLYPVRHDAPNVEAGDIALAVGRVNAVDMDEVEKTLRGRVMGQDHAVETVLEQLSLRDMGLIAKPDQPEGTFLFTGPSGTGKTELVKAFADATGRKLLRFDMGNYKNESGVQAFFGPPPGYQGADAGGQLTQAVLDHPDAVILLDEIEKADPRIWDAFMSVFDDGTAKDTSSGEAVPFGKTVIFMTSNLITADVNAEEARDILRESGFLRPEFVNRIENVVPFRPLDDGSKLAIVRKVMQEVIDNYNRISGETLAIRPGWCERYRNVSLENGTRDLQRQIQRDLHRHVLANQQKERA